MSLKPIHTSSPPARVAFSIVTVTFGDYKSKKQLFLVALNFFRFLFKNDWKTIKLHAWIIRYIKSCILLLCYKVRTNSVHILRFLEEICRVFFPESPNVLIIICVACQSKVWLFWKFLELKHQYKHQLLFRSLATNTYLPPKFRILNRKSCSAWLFGDTRSPPTILQSALASYQLLLSSNKM